MRATSMAPRSRMAFAASSGTIPSSARVSLAAASTSSHMRYLFSSLQIWPIFGRV